MSLSELNTPELVSWAYDLQTGLRDWFARSVALVRPHIDDGFGAYGAIARRDPPTLFELHLDGAHPINRALIAIGPSVGMYERIPDGFCASTASEVLGSRRNERVVAPFRKLLPAPDFCGITGPDGAGLMLVFAAPRRAVGSVSPHDRYLAGRILPHFAAGLRLRRSLSGLALDTASAEGLFAPNGRCVNAQGMADPKAVRDVLRQAVLQREVDRTHAEIERENPLLALLEGRWSLVDRFDTDGRRFIVAYRNPEGVLDPRRLSARERDVAARIAQGMSQTAVAAELGIKPSTVATVASVVVEKLGVRSTRELPLFWRDSAGDPVALGRGDLVVIQSFAPKPRGARLTAAEREVLDDVVHGRSNREIAARRRRSVRTVANQIAALLKKLGVRSRAGLSAQAPSGGNGPERG